MNADVALGIRDAQFPAIDLTLTRLGFDAPPIEFEAPSHSVRGLYRRGVAGKRRAAFATRSFAKTAPMKSWLLDVDIGSGRFARHTSFWNGTFV